MTLDLINELKSVDFTEDERVKNNKSRRNYKKDKKKPSVNYVKFYVRSEINLSCADS